MKVCILGDGLTSLSLAKALVNLDVKVDIVSTKKKKNYNKNQTIGISKTNTQFFNKNILNIKKYLWKINKIEIFNENFGNKKILIFKNDNQETFSMIKNFELNKYLLKKLNKNKLITFKKKIDYSNLGKKYSLIFNCDLNNIITKKFFYKKITKDYNSTAYATVIEHKKLLNNYIASQIFTKIGPIAFLPISSTETSVVYSIRGNLNNDLENLIKKFNFKYQLIKIRKPVSFQLKLSNLRLYYYKNILAFGDLLHRIHPLAGQGFNMSIRDIKEIVDLVKFKKEHGLDLDNSLCEEFEKSTKHKNYIFSHGIDSIYEFFNLDSKINSDFLSKSIQLIGQYKSVNKLFKKIADKGIVL